MTGNIRFAVSKEGKFSNPQLCAHKVDRHMVVTYIDVDKESGPFTPGALIKSLFSLSRTNELIIYGQGNTRNGYLIDKIKKSRLIPDPKDPREMVVWVEKAI